MKKEKRKSGFTLIELLVVIAIIAILAAMLLPVLKAARIRANNAVSINNLHEIGLAMYMYAQDYGGYVPPLAHNYAYQDPSNPASINASNWTSGLNQFATNWGGNPYQVANLAYLYFSPQDQTDVNSPVVQWPQGRYIADYKIFFPPNSIITQYLKTGAWGIPWGYPYWSYAYRNPERNVSWNNINIPSIMLDWNAQHNIMIAYENVGPDNHYSYGNYNPLGWNCLFSDGSVRFFPMAWAYPDYTSWLTNVPGQNYSYLHGDNFVRIAEARL
jgi:prepilin-type N-terminal cleavage/methylation domain-containing protein